MKKSPQLQIKWNDEKQEIDGFGCSQAGWAWSLYSHTKREEVMRLLFGEEGLNLNILRGAIYPHYSPAPGEYNFETTADIDLPFTDPIFDTETPLGNRYGQLWVTREARKVLNVENLMFSTWTPPGYMKTNGMTERGGELKLDEYQNFAELMTAFCKAYASVGLDVNIVSPTNEPEFPLVWDSCSWVKGENKLAPYVINNLSPTLQREGLGNIKIALGECAQWGPFLRVFGTVPYLTGIFEHYPEIAQLNTIAAGHGYINPLSQDDTDIIPIPYTQELGMHSWLTEISDNFADGFESGIENGIKWASKFHKYIQRANVSAILWWIGAVQSYSAEALIGLDRDRVSYVLTKRYSTFGNYSRYVKPGSKVIEISSEETVPAGVEISAFKKDNDYVMVAINPTDEAITLDIALDGVTPTAGLTPILTDNRNDWTEQATIEINADQSYTITLAPLSVTTYLGKTN